MIQIDVDIEKLARDLGCLEAWETIGREMMRRLALSAT
jgi:hypothetical protein